ncbi:chloride channel CLIC-like protein 1 isoform X1 [Fundulus heteroclitus]|uniref:chloride channel CLIC-like protein 1 isoform X1 n=1 Tax=Fundulus heteroclitus TaxID=8078 RepID=UPI00165C9902|nr:chloride channel CLIC-like protein 1 isoform X1 [Fundulus heteroclitus]
MMSPLAKPDGDPVFKNFLCRLMREVYRAGEPTDLNENLYYAKIKLSRPAIADIQSFLMGEDNWRTGALDDALSGMLVEVKPQSLLTRVAYTVGVDLEPLFQTGFFFMIGLLFICFDQRPRVSWFKMFGTIFAFSFIVSIPWNWLYLYKEAFAKHQSNIMKMEKLYLKCVGQKEISWIQSLIEWYRITWTLQPDPCEEYMKLILINPILEVPPIKAVTYTFRTFLIEPLAALGEGIGVFFRALLKDLPVTLWIPVLITVAAWILVAPFGGLPTVFNNYFRHFLPWREGNLPVNAQTPVQHQDDNLRLEQNDIHQRQPNRTRLEPNVQILGSADLSQSEETDVDEQQESSDEERNTNILNSEDQQMTPKKAKKKRAMITANQPKASKSEIDLQAKNKQIKTDKKVSHDEPCRDGAATSPLP